MPCNEYIFDMPKDGSYTDNIVVEAAARLLQCSITVIQEDVDVTLRQSSTQVHLGYSPSIDQYGIIMKTRPEFEKEKY